VGHFGEYFGWKWIILSNPHWSGKITDTPVLYGVEIVEDDYFVLSQCMHLTDRETDGQTKFDSNAVHYMQHGKNPVFPTNHLAGTSTQKLLITFTHLCRHACDCILTNHR